MDEIRKLFWPPLLGTRVLARQAILYRIVTQASCCPFASADGDRYNFGLSECLRAEQLSGGPYLMGIP